MRSLVPIVLVALVVPAFPLDDPPPTQQQQLSILGNVGSFVTQYINTVPNLVCVKVIEQYQGNKKGEHWRQLDTLTSRLTLVNGNEKATLELVNNKPVTSLRHAWRAPLTTEGEFGDMLATVLSTGSNATINWEHWDTLNGKRVAVFSYSIDQQHSHLRLSLSDVAEAVLPYSGLLYADPISGTVWRVTDHVSDIPRELHVRQMTTVLDYGEVDIAGKSYVLPVHATVTEVTDSGTTRNEITFSSYRKFEAESTITFGDSSQPK